MGDKKVSGTLIWYYYICPREVWFISHQIVPDQHDENIEWGRFLHENAYSRSKKEVEVGKNKLDVVTTKEGKVLVGEVKKTSSYKKSATMQLLYYLYSLKQQGIDNIKGELLFPEEKRKEVVELTSEAEEELERAVKHIFYIMAQEKPPLANKIKYCKKCAYQELCWS